METNLTLLKEYSPSLLQKFLGSFITLIFVGMGIAIMTYQEWVVGGTFVILGFLIAIPLMLPAFKTQGLIFEDKFVLDGVFRTKEWIFSEIQQVGEFETRVMNGAPIAINKANIHFKNGNTEVLKLRLFSLDDGKEILQIINSKIS